jgi:isopentenyl diphosphate isomerase/L-lactate dehydrogenase-like FMN-dependent dehydrogenase
MPVAIAPTGLTGMQHADGEILAARAAEKFGVPFTLSTMSICSIEDVAANTQPGAVLVPALRDARPRASSSADRPRQGRRTAARWC